MRAVYSGRETKPPWFAAKQQSRPLRVLMLSGLDVVVGKYLLTSAVVNGFSRRDGMRMNRAPLPPTVSFAISSGVSVTLDGTSGFDESRISEKSPALIGAAGKLLLL